MISADLVGYKSAMIWVNNLNYILLVILLSRYNHYRNAPYMFQRHVAVGHVGDQVQECNQNIYTFRNIYFDKYFINFLGVWSCEVTHRVVECRLVVCSSAGPAGSWSGPFSISIIRSRMRVYFSHLLSVTFHYIIIILMSINNVTIHSGAWFR